MTGVLSVTCFLINAKLKQVSFCKSAVVLVGGY